MFIKLTLARSLKFDSYREWEINVFQIDGVAHEEDENFGYKSIVVINGEICYSPSSTQEIKEMIKGVQ